MKRQTQILLLVYQLLLTVPFGLLFPLWLLVPSLMLTIIGFSNLLKQRPKPKPITTLLFTIAIGLTLLFANLIRSFEFSYFQWATLLLFFVGGLKSFETRKYRDVMTFLALSYMTLFCILILNSSLFFLLYGLGMVIGSIGLLFDLHSTRQVSFLESLKRSLRFCLLMSPVFIFLFVFFPRFQMNSMGVRKSTTGRTGFSPKIEPGTISELVQSDRVALNVYIRENTKLPFLEMYWRGAVLNHSQGLSWTQGVEQTTEPQAELEFPVGSISQSIVLYPQEQPWLFGLDMPITMTIADEKSVISSNDQSEFTISPLPSGIVVYEVKSWAPGNSQVSAPKAIAPYLQTPQEIHPKIANLVADWQNLNLEPENMARKVMEYFKQQHFSYSRQPDLPSGDPLYSFLFETQKGFCEHFAAAFATLMRLLGIPARVVVGFQGGTHNYFGNYYVVKDADAHAWTEIWLAQKGWVRQDPTSVVAPLRLMIGGAQFNQLDFENSDQRSLLAQYTRAQTVTFSNPVHLLPLLLDSFNYKWDLFLTTYTTEFQTFLLKHLGLGNLSPWTMLTLVTVGAIGFGLLLISLHLRTRTRPDKLTLYYLQLLEALQKRGVVIDHADGPLTLAQKASKVLPNFKAELDEVFFAYIQLRFGKTDLRFSLKNFKELVGAIKISPIK